MTVLLQWRMPDPAIVARWRGPDGRLAQSALAVPLPSIPTIIGPPGVQGPAGPQGPVPDVIDAGTFT